MEGRRERRREEGEKETQRKKKRRSVAERTKCNLNNSKATAEIIEQDEYLHTGEEEGDRK
jgi:hypothetical protein